MIGEIPASDVGSRVMSEMNLKEAADVLDTLLANAVNVQGGNIAINLTKEQHTRLVMVAHMFKLADLVNYKLAQDSFPRLLNAVKLVLAIADHPEQNPEEKISLAPKTRAQLDSAVKFAENRERIS